MGQSTDAILAYGYDLGGPEDWKIRGWDWRDEQPKPDWFDEDDDGAGFADSAITVLSAKLLGTVISEDDWSARSKAEKLLKVSFITHCSGDYPMLLLVAQGTTASRGYPKFLGPLDFYVDPEWHAALTEALTALEIVPTQEDPRWVLASYWD